MQTIPSRLSAGTPKTVGPLVESSEGERFAGRLSIVRGERDSPARLVHGRQGSKGSSEKQRGLRSTLGRKSVGFITENQPFKKTHLILARHRLPICSRR